MKFKRRDILLVISVTITSLFILFPFYWIFKTSITIPGKEQTFPLEYFPSIVYYQNYLELPNEFPIWIGNSLIISSVATAITLILAINIAFATVYLRYRFCIGTLIYFLIIGWLPYIGIVYPIFIIQKSLNLLGTHLGLILPYVPLGLGLTIWILTGWLIGTPRELFEAAILDGCSPTQILWKIYVPNSRPGLLSAGLLLFIANYQEYMIASVVNPIGAKPLMVGLETLSLGIYVRNWAALCAAMLYALIPIILIVLLGRKWIVSGITGIIRR
jgi:multiple sugar transport system permease protein